METLTTLTEIEEKINKDVVMIIAKTRTCATCRMVNAHLEQKIHAINDIPVYQVYVDDVDEFRGKYVIFSVPTVLIYSQGKELLRESKFISTQKINRLLEQFLDQ